MPWFKIDDGFWSHPKVIELSDPAVALWVRAGSYCAGHLTDGLVRRSTLRMLGADRDAAIELVLAGLWDETGDGWSFHDWDEYQPTREQVLAEREAKQDASALANHTRWHENRNLKVKGCALCYPNSDPNGIPGGIPLRNPDGIPRPVPSRPDDSSKTYVGQSSSNRARETTDSGFTSEMSKRMASQAGIKDPGMLAGLIRTALGVTVQWDHLAAIVNHLTRKSRSPVKDGQAYAVRCLSETPEEVRQFIFESGFAA